MLKLHFNIEQTANIDPKTIITSMTAALKVRAYEVSEITDSGLVFHSNPWRIRWNFQQYIAFNGGEVEVQRANGTNLICLNYYMDFFHALLIVLIPIVITVNEHEYGIGLFFFGFYLLVGIASIIRSNFEAKLILKEILNASSE